MNNIFSREEIENATKNRRKIILKNEFASEMCEETQIRLTTQMTHLTFATIFFFFRKKKRVKIKF